MRVISLKEIFKIIPEIVKGFLKKQKEKGAIQEEEKKKELQMQDQMKV